MWYLAVDVLSVLVHLHCDLLSCVSTGAQPALRAVLEQPQLTALQPCIHTTTQLSRRPGGQLISKGSLGKYIHSETIKGSVTSVVVFFVFSDP